MKTKIFSFVLLIAMLAGSFNAFAGTTEKDCLQNKSQTVDKEKEPRAVKFALTSNLSDTPGKEGVEKMSAFANGDDRYLVTRNSSPRHIKVASKMAEELCKCGKITYEEYCLSLDFLGKKPKAPHKVLPK